MTAREKISTYCTIQKEQGRRGDVLVYGKHKYRMNRLVANLSDEECEKVVKLMELDAHIAKCDGRKAKKAAGTARVVVEAKPCECGCGAMAKPGRRFLPGHDMKLKCALRKLAAEGDAVAKKELKTRGWA